MDQISDAGRAGDEANKIRQRPCQGHVVQSSCSTGRRLSRLEAGHSDCELENFLYRRARQNVVSIFTFRYTTLQCTVYD